MFITAAALAATVVFLLAHLAGFVTTAVNVGANVERDPAAVAARMQPVGHVVAQAIDRDAAPVVRAASDIYGGVCAACHDTGAAGAPKLDDRNTWAERVGQGLETVIAHAINGFNGMPARGGDSSLSDEEVAKTVAFMLDRVGVDYDASDSSLLVASLGTSSGTASDGAAEPAVGQAAADEGEPAASDPETATTDDAGQIASASVEGDAAAGQAKYATCIACHGAQGQGMGIFPAIAGRDASYISDKLKRYRAGEQVGANTALMYPNAMNLSDDDIANLSAYIGSM
ncbi:MAG: c-type cytochrome [Thioalkalivibrionaceae bacterium]